jgi:hypothetical protein
MVDVDTEAGVDKGGDLIARLEEVLCGGESLVGGDHGGVGVAIGTVEGTGHHGGNRRAKQPRN